MRCPRCICRMTNNIKPDRLHVNICRGARGPGHARSASGRLEGHRRIGSGTNEDRGRVRGASAPGQRVGSRHGGMGRDGRGGASHRAPARGATQSSPAATAFVLLRARVLAGLPRSPAQLDRKQLTGRCVGVEWGISSTREQQTPSRTLPSAAPGPVFRIRILAGEGTETRARARGPTRRGKGGIDPGWPRRLPDSPPSEYPRFRHRHHRERNDHMPASESIAAPHPAHGPRRVDAGADHRGGPRAKRARAGQGRARVLESRQRALGKQRSSPSWSTTTTPVPAARRGFPSTSDQADDADYVDYTTHDVVGVARCGHDLLLHAGRGWAANGFIQRSTTRPPPWASRKRILPDHLGT